ncbi:hypothetical protein EN803_43210, partial [Mesorhizobium sp. M2D.F.Ca.ET.160.01.1.1]
AGGLLVSAGNALLFMAIFWGRAGRRFGGRRGTEPGGGSRQKIRLHPRYRRRLALEANGAIAIIDNPAIDLTALMEIVPGPDFPTGGIVLGRSG